MRKEFQMKKRNLKGMTLMEIVVSMAVYGVLALLLVEIMSCVNGTMRTTNQLNKRLAYEAKFADNRLTEDGYGVMTATPRTLQIMYGSESIPSGAAEYTARYENTNHVDDDRSAGTNYKYLVYAPPSATTPTGKFTVRIRVDSTYPFPINSITSDVGPFTLDATTGEYVNNTIEYPDTSHANGMVEINAVVNCDMSSLTHGRQPINDEHGNFIAYSDDYPQETVVIRYVTWIMDSSGNQRNIKSAAIYNLDEHGRFTLVQGINQ